MYVACKKNLPSLGLSSSRFPDPFYPLSRSYNPAPGRFASMDDLVLRPGDTENANLYAYVGGNPVNASDPSGHMGLADLLFTMGAYAMLGAIALPAIHGALTHAYHVTATGTTENLFSATMNGEATLDDWKRAVNGMGDGAGAGIANVLDTLSFRLITPLHSVRDRLWEEQGLQTS